MKSDMNQHLPENPRGWILYDGRCGLCTTSARRLARWLGGLGYRLAPLQARWVVERIGSQTADYPREMILLTPEGKLFGGADAFIQIMADVAGDGFIVRLLRGERILKILRWGYRCLASRRHQISRSCRLKPMTEEEILATDGKGL